jgi:peptidoglycan/xylan/chitin deacetylase (PgdA/CDA1 family)
MKPYIILREDDANATTRPKDIERIYEPLIKLKLPINVAVIPSVYCANGLPEGHPLLPKQKYYPYIHESIGEQKYLSFKSAEKLISLFDEEHFEVLQHGYSHERLQGCPEFGIRDQHELESRVLRGKQILKASFGKEPRFFVAPHEFLSKQAFKIVMKNFAGTFVPSISTKSFLHDLPLSLFPSFLTQKTSKKDYYLFKNNFMLLETRGSYLLPYTSNIDAKRLIQKLIQQFKVVVIVNHYWQYSSNKELEQSWFELLDFLIKSDCTFISCTDLHEKLHS